MEDMKIATVITAGGMGLRLPGDVKKQFRLLNGKPLLIWSLELLAKVSGIGEIVVALPSKDIDYFTRVCSDYFPEDTLSHFKFCEGGQQRQESVFNALKLCPPDSKLAIIHDGVRPFITVRLIEELIKMTKEYGAAIPGAPVRNTIKTTKEDIIDHTIRRDILLQVYTPQVFDYNILMKCYHKAMIESYFTTDDAALLEHYGYSVHYLIDSSFNLKITDEFDFFLAEQVIRYNALPT